MATDPKVIAVAMAIKQSLLINSGPGAAINSHPNAFFLNVNGAVDLYKAAEAAMARVASYEEATATRFHEAVAALQKKLSAEFAAGAVSIQDAVARIRTKAGGELVAAEGALEEAIGRHMIQEAQPKVDETAASATDGH